MLAGMYFDEIRHSPVDNSIIQVSERAAQNECQGDAKNCIALAARAQKHDGNRDEDGSGKSDEHDVAPGA